MTFTKLLELYKSCGGTKVTENQLFRLTDFGKELFNLACNTNYFSNPNFVIEVTRTFNSIYGSTNMLIVSFHIGNATVSLKDCGSESADSYKSHTVELLMAWITQIAGLTRIMPMSQAVTGTRNVAISCLPLFDAYAFRQLLKQDFDNPKDYYVCNLRYTLLFFDARYNEDLLRALKSTESSLLKNYDGTPEMAWRVFWQNCQARGLQAHFRLTDEDRKNLTNWLANYFTPTYIHAEDTYEYKTSMLSTALSSNTYRLWGKFCATTAKRIVHPRCNGGFKTQC